MSSKISEDRHNAEHLIYRAKTYALMASVDQWLEKVDADVMSLIEKIDDIEFFDVDEEEENVATNAELVCRLVDELQGRLHDWIDDRFHQAGWYNREEFLKAVHAGGRNPCP